MEKTTIPSPINTIAVYRELFDQIDLHSLTQTQLLDLAALSAEQSEGLCNGLLLFIEPLQKNSWPSAFDRELLSSYLNATAHLLPALCTLYGRALREMEYQEVIK